MFWEIKQNAPKPREQQEQGRCLQGLNTQINLDSNKSIQYFHIESYFKEVFYVRCKDYFIQRYILHISLWYEINQKLLGVLFRNTSDQ